MAWESPSGNSVNHPGGTMKRLSLLLLVSLFACKGEQSAIIAKAETLCRYNQLKDPTPDAFPDGSKPDDLIRAEDLQHIADKEKEAKRFLKLREGDVATGRLVIPRVERIRFEELAEDFLNDYQINGRRSLDKARRSVRHLSKYFGGCRITNITTANMA